MAQMLVVDDEDKKRKSVCLVLQQEGHAVVEAFNGKRAIRHIQEAELNLVISDVVMPDMDGFELIREIRRTHPGMRILAISGAGKEGSVST